MKERKQMVDFEEEGENEFRKCRISRVVFEYNEAN